jgi:ABC-type nickel/cobalt efflux system permease component RcnA
MKLILEILALLAIGWVSGAEIGSWFGIQPIVAKLPYDQQVHFEQAMLKTFGRIMPVIMPCSAAVVVFLAILSREDMNLIVWLRVVAALCIGITIVTTLTINVPINNITAKWEMTKSFENWSEIRAKWHSFQGLRGGLFLLAFILLAIASTIQHQKM